MPEEVTQPPLQMLREQLRTDSPLREASISTWMAACNALCIPFVFGLVPLVGWPHPLLVNALLAVVALYNVLLLRAFRRGWFRARITLINIAIEVSLPAVVLILSAVNLGAEYAMMTPIHVIWGGLAILSSLRARPRLSIAAGVLAATEWMAIYFAFIVPRLPPNPGPSLLVVPAVLRALILIMSGGFGSMIASHYVRKAEEVLTAVREQDLMGKYFLHERIGMGGMAEVFRATYCPEGGFQKLVAIKRVLPTYSSRRVLTDMFREEAKLCAMLAHPNIVQVLDCGTFRDRFILAMEYVDGLPLSQLLRRLRRPMPLNAVAFIGFELTRALDYVHKKVDATGRPLRLVHRDVNPPNILFSRIGEVKLGDFGVANAAMRVETGRTDVFYGKLHYAAPEQLVAGPFDGRADLFALGLTLNEALTGRPVYGKESDSALNQGIFPRIPRPSEVRADVPPDLDGLIMSLCEVDVPKRLQSGADAHVLFSALKGESAPFPGGQQALALAVEEAIGTPHSEARERATSSGGVALTKQMATPGVFENLPAESLTEAEVPRTSGKARAG